MADQPLTVRDPAASILSASRQQNAIQRLHVAGKGNIGKQFGLSRKYRLVFIRVHFSGGSGSADFSVTNNSALGAPYYAKLFTVSAVGVGRDVNLRITEEESVEPSAWTFQATDLLLLEWINPDPANTTWGIEIGLAPAL